MSGKVLSALLERIEVGGGGSAVERDGTKAAKGGVEEGLVAEIVTVMVMVVLGEEVG